ncbi:hypothetical protein JTB14_031228 [Gonioctena quinquepunctata]|nr:hypothetical protein JTB14_031228 [Gonioctena quinquepunctata]
MRKKPLTTVELLDEIEKLDEGDVLPPNIYISPPVGDGIETDEVSGEGDVNDPDRLSGHQLQAATEVDITEDVQRVIRKNQMRKLLKVLKEKGRLENQRKSRENGSKTKSLT